MSNNTNNPSTTTGSGSGIGDKVKGAFETVHGLGDSLRGQGMQALDSAFKTPQKADEHATLAEKGRQEFESGLAKFRGQGASNGAESRHPDQGSQDTSGNRSTTNDDPSSTTDVRSGNNHSTGVAKSVTGSGRATQADENGARGTSEYGADPRYKQDDNHGTTETRGRREGGRMNVEDTKFDERQGGDRIGGDIRSNESASSYGQPGHEGKRNIGDGGDSYHDERQGGDRIGGDIRSNEPASNYVQLGHEGKRNMGDGGDSYYDERQGGNRIGGDIRSNEPASSHGKHGHEGKRNIGDGDDSYHHEKEPNLSQTQTSSRSQASEESM